MLSELRIAGAVPGGHGQALHCEAGHQVSGKNPVIDVCQGSGSGFRVLREVRSAFSVLEGLFNIMGIMRNSNFDLMCTALAASGGCHLTNRQARCSAPLGSCFT